jgi:hypothetical protein
MAADSMTRLESGDYYLQLSGCDYRVQKVEERVSTGRTAKGRNKTTWKAFRGDELIAEVGRYSEAKAQVWADANTTPEQAAQAARELTSVEQTDEGTDDETVYDDGRGETAIGPPTTREREQLYSVS